MILIFDLDGTILDTYQLIRENFIRVFEKYLPDYKYTEEDLKSFFGPPLKDTFKKIGCSDTKAEFLFNEYRKISDNLQETYLKMFPDTEYVLDKLKKDGFKLAIFSNKVNKAITSGLEITNLIHYFDMIVGVDEVSNPKPHQEGIEKIRNALNDHDCIYIGDTVNDIRTAKNASVDGIGVAWALTSEDKLKQSGAKYVVKTMKEFLELMEKCYV